MTPAYPIVRVELTPTGQAGTRIFINDLELTTVTALKIEAAVGTETLVTVTFLASVCGMVAPA